MGQIPPPSGAEVMTRAVGSTLGSSKNPIHILQVWRGFKTEGCRFNVCMLLGGAHV